MTSTHAPTAAAPRTPTHRSQSKRAGAGADGGAAAEGGGSGSCARAAPAYG